MKITKLPNVLDPSLMIQKKMREKFAVCPFCGESRRKDLYGKFGVELINYVPSKGYYGRAKGDWFGPKHLYHIDCYRCRTCGAEWESDPYPVDITGL
mgnify:CR=1 FL=1